MAKYSYEFKQMIAVHFLVEYSCHLELPCPIKSATQSNCESQSLLDVSFSTYRMLVSKGCSAPLTRQGLDKQPSVVGETITSKQSGSVTSEYSALASWGESW